MSGPVSTGICDRSRVYHLGIAKISVMTLDCSIKEAYHNEDKYCIVYCQDITVIHNVVRTCGAEIK